MSEADIGGGSFPAPDLLWSIGRLADCLGRTDLSVLDVRPSALFVAGHVPGALSFDLYAINCFDTDPAPLAAFLCMYAYLLGQRGVAFDDEIVVCGEVSGMRAARAFWMLELFDHGRAHVLDGGFHAWRAAGHPVSRDAEVPPAAPFRPGPRPERLATHHDVTAALDDAGAVILDTRSPAEWLGTDRRAARGGAIPSAVHQDWEAHLTPEGRLRTASELLALFEAVGVTRNREIIAYCNTGYRSAHAYLALRLLGYPRVRNYLGSWQEWAERPELPVVVAEAGSISAGGPLDGG